MKITKEIQNIVNKIVKEYQPEKIILFGSYAWGNPDKNSDVDLFIVKNATERRIDRARTVRNIIWGSGLPIDILVYTQKEINNRLNFGDFFVKNILEKGESLYSSSS